MVYKLPNSICDTIFSIRKLIQNSFDYFIYWILSKKVTSLTSDESIEKFIKIFKGKNNLNLIFLITLTI